MKAIHIWKYVLIISKWMLFTNTYLPNGKVLKSVSKHMLGNLWQYFENCLPNTHINDWLFVEVAKTCRVSQSSYFKDSFYT